MALKPFAAAGKSRRRPSGAGSPTLPLLALLALLALGCTSAQRSVQIQQHLYALQPQTASHQGATQACGNAGQLALATTAAGLQALRQLCGQHPCWVQDSHIVGLCPYIREGRVYQGQCETPRHYVCQKDAPPEHASPTSGHQEARQDAGPGQQLSERQGKHQGQQYTQGKARTLQQDSGAAAAPPPTNSSAAQALAALQPLLERLQSGGDLSADTGTGIVMMPIIVPSQNGPHTIYALLPGGTQRPAPAPASPTPSPSPSPTPSVRAADGPATPAGNQTTDPSLAFWMALLRRSPAPSPSPSVTTQTSNIDLLAALLQAQERLQQEGASPTAPSSPSTLPSPGPPSVLTPASPQLPTPSPGSASPSPSLIPSASPAPPLNSSSPASGSDASPLQSPPADSSSASSPEPPVAQMSPSPSSEDAQPSSSPSSPPAASPTLESPLPSPDLQSPSPSLPSSPSPVPQTTGPAGSSSPAPATSPATTSPAPSMPPPALQTSPGSLAPPSPPSLLATSAVPEEQGDSRATAATPPGDSPSTSTPTILGLAIALPLALVLGVAASLLFMRWRHRQQAFKTRIVHTVTPSPHPPPSTQRSATTTASSTIGLRHAAHSAAAASPSQGNSTDASGEDAASGPLQRLMTGGMTPSDLLQAVYALTAAVAASERGPAALQQPKRAPRGPDLPPDSFASTDSGRSRDPTQHGGSRPARPAGGDAGYAAGAHEEVGRRARQAYAPEDAFLPVPGGGAPHRHTHPSAGQGVFNMHALDANARQPPSRWPAVQYQDREEASTSNHPPAHVSVTPPAARPSAAATARLAKGSAERTQPAAAGATRAPSPAPWPFPPSGQPSSTDEPAYYDREASYAPDSPDEQPWQPEAQTMPQPAPSSVQYSRAARTVAGAPPTRCGEPPRTPGTSQPASRHPSVAGGASGATRVSTRGGAHALQDPLPPEDQGWAAQQPQGRARKAYGAGAAPVAMQYKDQEEEEGEQRQERGRTAAADLSPQQAANHLLDALMHDMRRHQERQQQQRQQQQQQEW